MVLLMALWLPFHALVAVAMPFCQDMSSATNTHTDRAPSHQHNGSHHGDQGAADEANHAFSLECNDCGPCHLACAPVLGTSADIVVMTFSQHLYPLAQALPPARMLDQPHPPPLA